LFLIPYSWNDALSLAYGLSQQTGNPNLKWELSATKNYGLDVGFLNQRITGSIDYYDTRTSDLLLQRSLPTSSGVKQVIQNIGKTKNSGIELTIQANVIKTTFFNWNSSVTYTMNKEEIIDLVNGQNDVANAWFIGNPVNSFYDYKKTGIWQTVDSTLAKSFGAKPGDIKVADINGDGKITSDDRTVIGSTTPNYILSFNNDFTIGNFDLNIFIFARQGQTIKSNFAAKYEPNAIENGTPVDYWTPENPTNNYPRPTTALSRAALPYATSLQYIDGSFIKIRNITLGYTLPKSINNKLKIKKIRVYMSAKNFITLSDIKNFDPENAGSYETPLTKLFVAGVNIDF
ncbi:MAG: TonB-dependent receptor, partial [Sediminibacterium sp.]|nr:TonB-dependent receptor [Sediminibacterium sp.]